MQQFESYAAMFFGVLKKAFFPIDFVLLLFSLLESTTLDTHNSQTTHQNWFKFWISQLNVINNI